MRVLIANRGEIAVRIIKTLIEMGMTSLVVYSPCDSQAAHVQLADTSFALDDASDYANPQAILRAAKELHADAIHPGYGFISENAEAAHLIQSHGIRWIGPSPSTIDLFGAKHSARAKAIELGLPVIQGSPIVISAEECLSFAKSIGFPCILKATAGGGGMGQFLCTDEASVPKAFASATSASQALFGDPRVYLERFVENSRHIEVQVFGDGNGKVVHFGERDCSAQRRRQKVVEEAPAANLEDSLREQILNAAVSLCSKSNYESAGTVEFLVDNDMHCFYFLEVNTRIQVEHGVSELVFNVDIVRLMVEQAFGLQPLEQFDHQRCNGHAIEIRVYAENPLKDFCPSTGTLTKMEWPVEKNLPSGIVRTDVWATTGTVVTSNFDPLLGKLMCWAPSREKCISLLVDTIDATFVHGFPSNLEFSRAAISSNAFIKGQYTTTFLDALSYRSNSIEVLRSGLQTSIQDYPGRENYWDIGVSPSGALDSNSLCLGNSILENSISASALEITVQGPSLLFHSSATVILTGARFSAEIDDMHPVEWWKPFQIKAGSILDIGDLIDEDDGHPDSQFCGKIAYLAIAGGFDIPSFLGSASTFPTGKFGGLHGGFLKCGDFIPFKAIPNNLSCYEFPQVPRWLLPTFQREWSVGTLCGPHASEEFLHKDSIAAIWNSPYIVHRACNRLGVRLMGSLPQWSRPDGGDAGLHPSNLHDYTYTVGAVNFSGNTAIVLMADGPSLGGFVCPVTVAKSELWKIAQARPNDIIRFHHISYDTGRGADLSMKQSWELLRNRDMEALSELQHKWTPNWVHSCLTSSNEPAILHYIAAKDVKSDISVCYRLSGSEHVLVEYGEIVLDLRFRFRVHMLMENLKTVDNIIELCPGVRSLLIRYDASKMHVDSLIKQLSLLEHSMGPLHDVVVPSRCLELPIAFDDQWTKEAQSRYALAVRPEAPYLPSNVEFIRRMNGLDSIDQVRDIMCSAEYMVLGLGDVYLGAPCAVPVDPRHRLVTSKYNPARTYTPEGAVGIGGAYLCIYGMDSPGGYQLCGRTLPIWDSFGAVSESNRGRPATIPWLLRFFDRIKFYPVSDNTLLEIRSAFMRNAHSIPIVEDTFSLKKYLQFTNDHEVSIREFQAGQQLAFQSERERWEASGEDKINATSDGTEASVDEKVENVVERPPFSACVSARLSAVVWKVSVSEGDVVESGDVVMILESMKVEIEVQAPVSGKVISLVQLREGDTIEANQHICFIQVSQEYAMGDFSSKHLRKMFKLDIFSPETLSGILWENAKKSLDAQEGIFISLAPKESVLERARHVMSLKGRKFQPLYGLPYFLKDNIDMVNCMTTAGCPSFGGIATESAECVKLIEDAGAIFIGKSNMDQFATGLVGTRSPYGIPLNPFNAEYISGGSSSGSAVSVSSGFSCFSLGTDTAGSGRVPAALNGIVGLKPTKGVVSTKGIVPACESLDCVSIFARNCQDASLVLDVIRCTVEESESVPNVVDISEIQFAVPHEYQLEFFDDQVAASAFSDLLFHLKGARLKFCSIDFAPFKEAADMLYSGSFVAERYSAVGEFIESFQGDDSIDSNVERIILASKSLSAHELFSDQKRVETLKDIADSVCWNSAQVLVVPSVPTVFTVKQVLSDPISTNSKLGVYTNFVNLMDLCALAIPIGARKDNGIPWGITLIAKPFHENLLISLGQQIIGII